MVAVASSVTPNALVSFDRDLPSMNYIEVKRLRSPGDGSYFAKHPLDLDIEFLPNTAATVDRKQMHLFHDSQARLIHQTHY